MNKGKILALDYGRTIGLAVSDIDRQMAFGRGTLDRGRGLAFVCDSLKDLCMKEAITEIVIGLPLNMEGDETEQTKRFRGFAAKLELVVHPIPIFFQDEAFTTFEANQFQTEMGVQSRDLKKNEDELAAIFILKRYLGSITN